MKHITLLALVSLLYLSSCGQHSNKKNNMELTEHKYTNALINQSSPYLLQHAHNPVNWYPWGDEALKKAADENKLLIISIGYAACHWCHVMEHESFENETVAQFMNDNFVCIKVDREERPDIDQVYMNAVQLLTGSGGWPLNCIALPDGRPLYGGTYFPAEQWLDMLTKVLAFVKENPDKTEQQATELTKGVRVSERIAVNTQKASFSITDLHTVYKGFASNFDIAEGGGKGAPKFPLPVGYQYLLQYYALTNKQEALQATILSLNKMANGGIYDQVGGGFSRYSTDAYWKVPHFEKMLYDNAQLVSLYSGAYKLTKDANYKTIVSETLKFIETELSSSEGGFYTALDADSEGVEGKYYVWTQSELQQLLGKNAELIIEYYNVTAEGNWEHNNNILYKSANAQQLALKHGLNQEQLMDGVNKAKDILLKARNKRVKPALDNKSITAWNALMLTAYTDAYQAFGNEEYLDLAEQTAQFIETALQQSDKGLFRNYKNGVATINGFLDDYAFTIEAFIALYQVSFNEKYLHRAQELTQYVLEHFSDTESGMFFYTSNLDDKLIARKMEVSDNVIPSSNSQMAKNLFVLGHYFQNPDYINKAESMLNNVKQYTYKSGTYYANWDMLMAWFVSAPYEVAVVGKNANEIRKQLATHYLPNVLFSGGIKESNLPLLKGKLVGNKTTIYVCKDKTCKLPVYLVEEALQQLNP